MTQTFQDSLHRLIVDFTDEYPETPIEEIISALEARAILLRQEISLAGNPGAN